MELGQFTAWVHMTESEVWTGFTKRTHQPYINTEIELYGEHFDIQYDEWKNLPKHKKMVWVHIGFTENEEVLREYVDEEGGVYIGDIRLAFEDDMFPESKEEPEKIAKVWINIKLPLSRFPFVVSAAQGGVMIKTAHYPKNKFPNSDDLESSVAVVRAIRFFNNEPEMTTKNKLERQEQKFDDYHREILVFLMAVVVALSAYIFTRSFVWALTAFIVSGLFAFYHITITTKRR
jgi:hypothetical protein